MRSFRNWDQTDANSQQNHCKFLHCSYSPARSRKLNLQVIMLRKSEKSRDNRLPDKWSLRFPLGRWASRSPPFSDARRSYLIVWHCPCAKLNCTFWCLWGCLKCSADRTPTRSLPGGAKSCPSLSLSLGTKCSCLAHRVLRKKIKSERNNRYTWKILWKKIKYMHWEEQNSSHSDRKINYVTTSNKKSHKELP